MANGYKVIRSLLQTEKGSRMLEDNKYLFWVTSNANKIDIKRAVEDIYKVTVTKVNTQIARGKKRRVRYVEGRTPDRKKAIVQLKQGDKIDLT